jgi:hypothetical protein
MILGDGGHGPTLDDLFRRAGVRHPHAIALADPPDRARVDGAAPRILTFTQADRAISAFAAKLRALGLRADAVVGLQLPNTVESVVALLGVLRAGMIAAPLPLLWRKRDVKDALARAGASALVTMTEIGGVSHAQIAVEVALELFPLRFVCAFGAGGTDGVIPLDDIFDDGPSDLAPPPHREQLGAHIAVLTFETRVDGTRVFARSHAQLVAAGQRILAECGLMPDGNVLSTIPISTFASLATELLPWLLGGGTLHLHHVFDAETFAAQCASLDGGAAIVPGPAVAALAGPLKPAGTVIALWRAPDRMASAPAQKNGIVDVACFGEIGLIATQRDRDGAILPLPYAADIHRTKGGTLAMLASGTPCESFPPSGPASPLEGCEGLVDAAFPCQVDTERGTVTVTGSPPGVAMVGGYRFSRSALDDVAAETSGDASVIAIPDALLGDRLAGHASDSEALEAELEKAGYNPLIARAFRPRTTNSVQF